MSEILGNALSDLNAKLQNIQPYLNKQLQQLDEKGIKWFQYDNKTEKLIQEGAESKAVYINVGGKVFQTSLLTILRNPDTLFFNLIMTDEWDPSEELFIDRNYTYFSIVLSFLRNGKVSLVGYKDEEVLDIVNEAKYYHVNKLALYLDSYCREVTYVAFEFSGEYRSGNQVAGTNNIEDLNNFDDTSCMRGICTAYTGWITIELSREVEFEQIEIGGYRGNTNLYSSSNGSGAQIKTSLDKNSWINVGTINSNYANGPYMHNVTLSKAKYIKFEHNSYLGIGYLRIQPFKK